MTIETATPSSLETLAGMFDTLVEHVAARVLFLMDAKIDARLDQLEANIDARIETALGLFSENQFDDMVDLWAANFLDDRVKEHVTSDTDDLHDQVLEIVQGLNYDVRVHVSS
jgi:hypothetical protein